MTECKIIPVGKRRDGGTRYWCLKHKADATAKYGRRGRRCRYAQVPVILPSESCKLDLADYPGGVAVWGAVPPVYDTTNLAIDKGIHVHARRISDGTKKSVDRTFRRVEILKGEKVCVISELDAIYFMVSSVFGFSLKHIKCSWCGYAHLDKDWFSVHPHQSHLCAGCGRTFRDSESAIGNPVASVQTSTFAKPYNVRRSRRRIDLKQMDYPGGIRIWGSNAPIIWTSTKQSETGIHLHAFSDMREDPVIDETYGEIVIDGVKLDIRQVRILMAQAALPHLTGRVHVMSCEKCGEDSFDDGANAYTPREERACGRCDRPVRTRGRMRKAISNPLIQSLAHLAKFAPRSPQVHDLGLLPETL